MRKVTMALFLLGALLAACSPTEKAEPQPIGMPNPASVHCTRQGGKLDIKTGKDGGQYGICHLPDGRQCEEWALFRDKTCVTKPE